MHAPRNRPRIEKGATRIPPRVRVSELRQLCCFECGNGCARRGDRTCPRAVDRPARGNAPWASSRSPRLPSDDTPRRWCTLRARDRTTATVPPIAATPEPNKPSRRTYRIFLVASTLRGIYYCQVAFRTREEAAPSRLSSKGKND